ncbi:LuxR family transcriptional regulator [Actinophytocola sp. KF-1]
MLATAAPPYRECVDDLVGRETELACLQAMADAAATGQGAAALIEGEPGIGKSALARAATNFAAGRGCHVLWAAADELGQALPLRPLLDACRHLATPRLTAIRTLLRGEFTGDLDPVAAASEHLLTLVAELCDATPVILVVDDLQWADQATIQVWSRLARTAQHKPLLAIGITRPTPERGELLPVRRAAGKVLRLAGLRDDDVRDLLAGLTGGRPGESLRHVAADASGNPLYLTELVAALSRAHRLREHGGAVEVEAGPIPKSLLGAVADRLDFLPRDDRAVLQAAALLGLEFLVADLAIVQNRRVPDLARAINHARTAGVLGETDGKLSFRHPLIRAALYDEIPLPVRTAWHRDAARALAEAGAPVHRVARQLLRAVTTPGVDPFETSMLDWLADAAATLVAQTPGDAVELLREACRQAPVTTSRGVVLAAKLAEAQYRSGDALNAERTARRALPAASDRDLLVELHWTIAQSRAFVGRFGASLDALGRALKIPGVSLRQRARLLVLTARAHRNLGNVSVAGDLAAEALATAEEAGDTWAVAWSLHVMIVVSVMKGNVAAALPLFDRALDVVADDPALTDLSMLLEINKAVALGDLDRYDEAFGTAKRVRRIADRAGSVPRLAQARSAMAQLLFEAGRWDDARREAEALPDEMKDPGATCCDHGVAAVIAFHRGDTDSARCHLDRAAPTAAHIGNRVVSAMTLARSLLHEVADEGDQALDVLVSCLAERPEELDEVEDLLPEAARLGAERGAVDVVADAAARAAGLAGRAPVPHRQGNAAYCRGLLDRSTALLLLAADKFAEAGRPLCEAKALEAAAVRFAEDGDRRASRAAFTRADEIYDGLDAGWDVARLRAALRKYGIRRGSRARHRQASTGRGSLTDAEERVRADGGVARVAHPREARDAVAGRHRAGRRPACGRRSPAQRR